MKTYKSLVEQLSLISEKKFKVGKHSAEIKKVGSKFVAYVNNEILDSNYKSEKDAESSIKDFIKLMSEDINT